MVDQVHIEYDGTLDGFLTVLARCVKEEIHPLSIAAVGQRRLGMFDTVDTRQTDSEQAERLTLWLQNLHPQALSLVIHAYLSGRYELGLCGLVFIKLCLKMGAKALQLHTHDETAALLKHSAALMHEVHSFTGFVRFRELTSGVFYAPIAPVNNIVFYIAEHFQQRLPLQKWMIHDTERNIALFWDTEKLQTVFVEDDFTAYVRFHGEAPDNTENEKTFQDLWQIFHRAIANPARDNPQLQKKFIPQRYWKYLIEKPT